MPVEKAGTHTGESSERISINKSVFAGLETILVLAFTEDLLWPGGEIGRR
jgi:hypothetical protein